MLVLNMIDGELAIAGGADCPKAEVLEDRAGAFPFPLYGTEVFDAVGYSAGRPLGVSVAGRVVWRFVDGPA
jgi:hypothetical protein